jgi:hypothetical protein
MIYECQREKISWNNRREGNFQYRNKEIIQIVINKLIEWDKLNDCIKTIKKDRNILSWEEVVEILEKESSEIKADYEVIINNNRENNSCSNDTSSGNGRNNNKHMTINSDNNTDMDSASILTQSMVNYVRDIKSTNSAKCYNCNNFGHLSSACKATYCNKCKRSWNSINDPGYHTSYYCRVKTYNDNNNLNKSNYIQDSNMKRKFNNSYNNDNNDKNKNIKVSISTDEWKMLQNIKSMNMVNKMNINNNNNNNVNNNKNKFIQFKSASVNMVDNNEYIQNNKENIVNDDDNNNNMVEHTEYNEVYHLLDCDRKEGCNCIYEANNNNNIMVNEDNEEY